MKLTSPVFNHGTAIPIRFTGEGQDISPPLAWSGVPKNTRAFALICEDPDAPKRADQEHPFVHWLIYDISPSVSTLPEGLPATARMEAPVLADQGTNSKGKFGYSGPMPPEGHGAHHYRFKLYALDNQLGIPPGSTRDELLRAIRIHALDTAELVGTYRRKAQPHPQKGIAMNNRITNLFAVASLGAVATYFFDPSRGRRRRAGIRDRIDHLGHILPRDLNLIARDLGHRTEGTIAQVRSKLLPHQGDEIDDVIEDRVRSVMGRIVSHPHAIQVCSDNGEVTLTGLIFSDEVKPLIKRITRIKGVKKVEQRLEPHLEDDRIPSLQGVKRRHAGPRLDVLQSNWAPATRLIMGLVGTTLASGAFLRPRPLPLSGISGALGLLILSRSITNLETKRLLGFGRRRGFKLHKTMEIDAPVSEVYHFWREFENFPLFMTSVDDVRTHGDKRRSHWTIRGPAGSHFHFDADRTMDIQNQCLAWKTVPGSFIRHSGQVKFFKSSRGGTKIELELSYYPPVGVVGLEFAKLLGVDPKKRVEESLYQMKQIIEQGPSPRQARARVG